MGLAAALRWWEEWQLRILVLSSLFVQGILFFSVLIRKLHALRKLRVVVWIAYIGSDALAIYALATLFNRHKELPSVSVGQGSSSLEIIWAPVLLIHLGGQLGISAYSLEDNELWKRHVITLVCQVTVALYVFCKWWSGDERQLTAAVLLFIVGIIKFGRKPWALWSASFNYMLAAADVYPRKPGFSCWRLCTANCCIALASVRERAEEGREEIIHSLQEYVKEANKCTRDIKVETASDEVDVSAFLHVYKMFIDMPAPYSTRLKDLRSFLKLGDKKAHEFFGFLLSHVFQILYTGMRSSASLLNICINVLLPALVLASLVHFAKSNKEGYDQADVTVTYILFASNVAQDFVPSWLIDLVLDCAAGFGATSCHDMVSQCNLMSFCVRKKNPTILMKLAAFNCLSEYINKHCYIEQVPAARTITTLVNQHVKRGWDIFIHDAAAYKRLNNLRGELTLRGHHELEWSLKVPFDHSVLLWHIATDLCFHYKSTTYGRQECAAGSRLISNYMVYLLFNHPEMLMPGTRPGLFNVASHQLDLMMMNIKAPLDSEETLVREIMDRIMSSKIGGPAPSRQETAHTVNEVESPAMAKEEQYASLPMFGACDLAESLMELGEEVRWKVIEGVWLEMLCYSASRCRGYLHAKSLGQGGEYLTTVWLLWSYMGMETLTYTIQSPELPQEKEKAEGGGGGGAWTSQSQGPADQSVDIYPVSEK